MLNVSLTERARIRILILRLLALDSDSHSEASPTRGGAALPRLADLRLRADEYAPNNGHRVRAYGEYKGRACDAAGGDCTPE